MTSENKTPASQRSAASRYLSTDAGKAAQKRYKKSAKGKATQIRADEKRKADPDRLEKKREDARAFRARQKAKREAAAVVPSEPPETDEAKQERRRAYQREWARLKREEKKE